VGERLADRNAPVALIRVADVAKERAPDGMDVYPLARANGASMAQFELAANRASIAISHRTVDEIWYVLSGRGEMWRRHSNEEVIALEPGVCMTIPCGTGFQVRAGEREPLVVVAVTMPPWPNDAEAVRIEGPWTPDF
jgi:mannose-6-phosphate isomerase-like protein (cupin superfamily)